MNEFVSLASRAPPTTKESNRNHTSVSIRPIAPRVSRASPSSSSPSTDAARFDARASTRERTHARNGARSHSTRESSSRASSSLVVVPRASRETRVLGFSTHPDVASTTTTTREDEDEDEDAVKRCENMRTFSVCAYFVAATVRLSFQEPTKNEGEAIARAPSRRVVCVCDVDILGRCVHTLVYT